MKPRSIFHPSLFLFAVIIGLVALVFTGCPNESNSGEGTIKVKLINAGVSEDKNFYFEVYNEGESNAAKDDPVAWGVGQIIGGTAEDIAEDYSGDVLFTTGEKYDIYVLVDLDDSGSAPNADDMVGEILGVEVDGNSTVTFDYTDLVIVS